MNFSPNKEALEHSKHLPSHSLKIVKAKTAKQQNQRQYHPSKQLSQKSGRYHWTSNEQKKYVNFLVSRRSIFEMSVNDRKTRGVHTKMSKIIKTRSSCQCRSHHQKMLVKHGSIDNIIISLKYFLTEKNTKYCPQTMKPMIKQEDFSVRQIEEIESFNNPWAQCKQEEESSGASEELKISQPTQQEIKLCLLDDFEDQLGKKPSIPSYSEYHQLQFLDFASNKYEDGLFISEFN